MTTPIVENAANTKQLYDDTRTKLFSLAKAEIYQHNVFRLLELSPHATIREINKRKQLMEVARRSEAPIPLGQFPILSIKEKLSEQKIDELVSLAMDPFSRLINRIFWFWPEDGGTDIAMEELKAGNLDGALQQWKIQNNTKNNNLNATHNIAILNHLRALESEIKSITAETSGNGIIQIISNWEEAFAGWRELIAMEDFWSQINEWVREENDPRLTTGMVRRLREHTPLFLILISGKLALSIGEKERYTQAKRLIQGVRLSQFPKEWIDEGLQIAASELEKKLHDYINSSHDQTNLDSRIANNAIQLLIRESQPLLRLLEILFKEKNPKLIALKDSIALAILTDVKIYTNKVESFSQSNQFLDDALRIASSRIVIEKLETAKKSYNEILLSGNYWYSEDYYQLPARIQKILEQARKLFGQSQFDQAIQLLEDTKTHNTSLSGNSIKGIDQALSVCFNIRGNTEMNMAFEEISKPRTLAKNIERRTLQVSGFLCQACNGYLGPQYFNFTHENRQYKVCTTCMEMDKREMSARKATLTEKINRGVIGFAKATKANPKNRTAQENYTNTLEMAQKMEITLTSDYEFYWEPYPSDVPPSDSASTPTSKSTSYPTSRPDLISNVVTFIIISILIIAMIFAYKSCS